MLIFSILAELRRTRERSHYHSSSSQAVWDLVSLEWIHLRCWSSSCKKIYLSFQYLGGG